MWAPEPPPPVPDLAEDIQEALLSSDTEPPVQAAGEPPVVRPHTDDPPQQPHVKTTRSGITVTLPTQYRQ